MSPEPPREAELIADIRKLQRREHDLRVMSWIMGAFGALGAWAAWNHEVGTGVMSGVVVVALTAASEWERRRPK